MTHNLSIYVIYDLVSKLYMTNPFFLMNDNAAKRVFQNMADNTDTIIYTNPQDYDLFHIGYYNVESGEVTGIQRELVMKGVNLLTAYERQQAADQAQKELNS